LGLVTFSIGLNFVADLMHRLPTDPNFAGNFGTGVTLADPTQQQDRLGRMFLSNEKRVTF